MILSEKKGNDKSNIKLHTNMILISNYAIVWLVTDRTERKGPVLVVYSRRGVPREDGETLADSFDYFVNSFECIVSFLVLRFERSAGVLSSGLLVEVFWLKKCLDCGSGSLFTT